MRALHPVPPGQEKDVARGVTDLRATSAPSVDELYEELAHHTREYREQLIAEKLRLTTILLARELIRVDA